MAFKKILLLASVVLSFGAQAIPPVPPSAIFKEVTKCPSQTQRVAICLSTPKAGDQEIAANIFDSITVCAQGASSILVLEKNGESDGGEAKVTTRAGGTTYLIQTPDIDFSLAVTTGIRSKTAPAQLKVNFKSNKIVATSTYTCTR